MSLEGNQTAFLVHKLTYIKLCLNIRITFLLLLAATSFMKIKYKN